MGGQQFLADGLMIDTRRLSNRVLAFDAEKGHIEVEAGMQWPQLLQVPGRDAEGPRAPVDLRAEADRRRQAHHRRLPRRQHPRPRPEDAALHRRRRVVQAAHRQGRRGRAAAAPRTAELFRLAIGGYGLFGMITSVTLRLVERRKVERVVEVRSIDGLSKAFAERIRDGFLYGDFQYAIDETSRRLPATAACSPATSRSTRKRRSRPASASCARATGPSCCTSRTTPRARRSAATPASTCRPTARCTGRTRRR